MNRPIATTAAALVAALALAGCASPSPNVPATELQPLAAPHLPPDPMLSAPPPEPAYAPPAQYAQAGGSTAQAVPAAAPARPGTPPDRGVPVDPWPVQIDLSNATVLVYSPQVNAWDGNALDFRAAVAVKAAGTGAESFGVVWATARTQVDRVARTVVLEDLRITKRSFPALPGNGASYIDELAARVASDVKTISLDRLNASLAVAGIKPPAVTVKNDPPNILVSTSPAILVPIAGAPVLKNVPGMRFDRVINTGAIILHLRDTYYIHVYDGWLSSTSISGPWSQPFRTPFGLDDAAQQLAKSGKGDLLDGGPKANPKPSLVNGVPTVYTSQVPTELIVFRGQPNLVPVTGTALLWASNTTADVIVNTANNAYYVLVSGRWYTAPGLNGPWTYVANNALPPDFARIPKDSPAGVVLATVAGTVQAQEAVIENSIPQTATVPRQNGPAFTPNFDGVPQYQPIAGTPLSYVPNTPHPIIRVDANTYYAVKSGVWFTATQITGPWLVATTVPAVIYTIPPSSPLHYVTYVQVYGYTPQVVYVGYTPGYLGTVVTPAGTVVYGTGYAYDPWIGAVWYPAPVTYGIAAAPIYNPAVGYTFGFALGMATAAWITPYWGPWYGTGYWGVPCCGSATANVYRNWGSGASYGTRTWYSSGSNIGTAAAGSYSNYRTGVSGSYSGYRNYNYASGWAQQGYTRTGTGQAGGSGSVTRSSGYNAYTGQRYYDSSASATGAGGSSVSRDVSDTGGTGGYSRSAQTTTYNAKTGETHSWNDGRPTSDNTLASTQGNAVRNSGGGWQQHSSGGWGGASGDTSWADREQQARSSFQSRAGDSGGWGDRSGGGDFGDRFGGGGGWGDHFSGGFGDRFGGGGGFGGGRFGGRR